MLSATPSWLHKASAFAVVVAGTAAAWNWDGIVSTHAAAVIVSVLGGAKLLLEFVGGDQTAA